ncbi:MAG TPA: phage portal protein [Alphaproteobacteria bacterium]|nr:phage portal protein [Alphaproteobacteria bacterium]
MALPLGLRLRWLARAMLGVVSPHAAAGLFAVGGGVRGEPPPRGSAEFLRAYSTMPWLRAVTHKISLAVATPPWTLHVVRRQGRVRRERAMQHGDLATRTKLLHAAKQAGDLEAITEHPLLDLLHRPNPAMTGMAARRLASLHLELLGEAIWIKERAEQGPLRGLIHALWPIPPSWLIEPPTPTWPFFRFQWRHWHATIPASEVLWLTEPNPEQPYGRGSGTAQSVADELETDEYVSRYLKSWFYNRAMPSAIITVEGARPEDIDRAELHWRQKTQGWWRAHLPFFSSRKMEFHKLSDTFENMQLKDLRTQERDIILQTWGINPEIMGVLVGSSRAHITAAEFFFQKHVVIPRLELQREFYQETLVPEFDDRLILGYVSPVEEDWDFHLRAAQAFPWAFEIDELRDFAGRPPKPDDAGKVHAVPFSLTFQRLDGTMPSQPASDAAVATRRGMLQPWRVQRLRFDPSKFTPESARAWAAQHGFDGALVVVEQNGHRDGDRPDPIPHQRG